MQKINVLFSLLGSLSLVAQEVETAPKLKGVLLVDNSSKVRNEDLDQINGVQFDGVSVPGGNQELVRELAPFLFSDFPLTSNGAEELCTAISSYYKEHDDLRISVLVPDQNSSQGVVQVVVTPERLGAINVKDNQYTTPETVKKWVRLSSDDVINEKTLAQDVGWINNITPTFRSVNVAYEPTEAPGITNVDLVVKDKKSWKISSGVENTGTNPLNPLRIFAGVNVTDFIFADHTLNLTGTTTDQYSKYQSYKIEYTAPLPWRNLVKVTGSYSGAPEQSEAYTATGRYIAPFWFGSNPWIDQISVEGGMDFKGTDTNIFYANNPPGEEHKTAAYIAQFVGGINATRKREGTKVTAGIDLIGSPGAMLPNQTEADFNNLREGATPTYFYSRLSMNIDQKLPYGWKAIILGKGHLAAANLLSSEQIAIGGHNTVRGYAEKAVNGDSGFYGNLEIRTPEFATVKPWFPKFQDSLCFLAFVDGGYAWFRESVKDEIPLDQSLLGVGSGLRYAISSYFTSRLDVGVPLLKVAKSNTDPRVHFSASLSY